MSYYEVSAKSGEGIKKIFEEVTNKIMEKILKNIESEEKDEKLKTSFLTRDNFQPKEKKCY